MIWNYRLVRKKREGVFLYDVHEVYYNDDGTPCNMSTGPATFGSNNMDKDDEAAKKEVLDSLMLAYRTITRHDIFVEPAEWGKSNKESDDDP